MAKRRIKSQPEARRPKGLSDGQRTEANGGKRLVTHQVGPIPIINRILQRMRLQDFLKQHLPTDDKRTKVDSARVVLLLIRNVLISREPIYGVTEWASNYRPDLKQLLYILTVTNDGGVPIHFQAASGNTADDQTHPTTWKLMAELVQRKDFIYVADCKLASTANMNEIARLHGRFITVLPTNRKENKLFRKRLRETPDSIEWKEVHRITNEDGTVRDVFRTASQEQVSKEVYRLLWFHSRGKAESDVETRTRQLQRAECELTELLQRVMGPRTRFRSKKKIQAAVDEILKARGMQEFLQVQVEETEEQKFRQVKRGRPNGKTKYTRYVVKRFELKWQIDTEQMAIARAADGVFPLISNVPDWKAEQILQAYKRQPIIEKRFSQLKTDFRVAPVYLKSNTASLDC